MNRIVFKDVKKSIKSLKVDERGYCRKCGGLWFMGECRGCIEKEQHEKYERSLPPPREVSIRCAWCGRRFMGVERQRVGCCGGARDVPDDVYPAAVFYPCGDTHPDIPTATVFALNYAKFKKDTSPQIYRIECIKCKRRSYWDAHADPLQKFSCCVIFGREPPRDLPHKSRLSWNPQDKSLSVISRGESTQTVFVKCTRCGMDSDVKCVKGHHLCARCQIDKSRIDARGDELTRVAVECFSCGMRSGSKCVDGRLVCVICGSDWEMRRRAICKNDLPVKAELAICKKCGHDVNSPREIAIKAPCMDCEHVHSGECQMELRPNMLCLCGNLNTRVCDHST
jgi:hypothetical protein